MIKDKKEFYKQIGNKIKKARLLNNMTQKDLINELGEGTYKSITTYEKGRIGVKLYDLYKLTYILNKPISYFFEDETQEITQNIATEITKEIINLNEQLFEAVANNDLFKVQELIKRGADVNAKDDLGKTVLMEASFWGDFKIVQLLLQAGADVNAKSKYGETALMWASFYGYSKIVQLFLENGADINAVNDDDETALMQAIEKGFTEISDLLKQHGATE